MTDFKDERSEPQGGWAAEGKRDRPDGGVIVLSLLSSKIFLFLGLCWEGIMYYALQNKLIERDEFG